MNFKKSCNTFDRVPSISPLPLDSLAVYRVDCNSPTMFVAWNICRPRVKIVIADIAKSYNLPFFDEDWIETVLCSFAFGLPSPLS